MKKRALLSFLLFCNIAFSQTSFGVKAGYSLSKLKTTTDINTINYNAKSGFYIGALSEIKLNNKFAIQGEFLYSSLGGSASYIQNQYPYEVPYMSRYEEEINYKTLQLPLMGKYYITNNIGTTAGISFCFIISGTNKTIVYENDTNELLLSLKTDADNTKRVSITPFFGLEYQFNNQFFIDGRYYFASNISKYDEIETKLSFLQIGLGYKFK